MQHSMLNPHGYAIEVLPDARPIEHDTQQCVHCGGHWMVVKGSGRPHVWCSRCGGNTCSNPKCLTECYPIEKKIDDLLKFGREIRPI